ncbi:MAG: DUF2635 domain-containing protein [Gallionella sp.]|jgi:hypothetical protein
MNKIFVKPAQPGLRVCFPQGGDVTPPGAPLPDEGDWVERDSFLIRRINDGDVIVMDLPKTKKAATATAA